MTASKADICLVYPPYRKLDFISSIPYLSGYAKQRGFRVDALDAPALGVTVREIVMYIAVTEPRSVGISIPFTPMADSGLELVTALHKMFPELPLIVGGIHPTLCPDEFTDYAHVCKGEGEKVLVDFLKRVKQGIHIGMKGQKILRKPVEIEEIAAPDWDIVEADKYSLTLPTGERAIPIQTSRGCPFDCVFCSNGFLSDRRVRYKTMDQVKYEFDMATDYFGVNCFSIRDENFTLNRDRFNEICKYLKEIGATFWAQTRADLIDDEMARVAKDSGCVGFSIGVETGDPEIMTQIKKGITLGEAEEAFKILKRAGLKSCALFMIGHAGETKISFMKTEEFAHKLDPDFIGFAIATPYPRTELRKEAISQGASLPEKWSEYITSRATFTPEGLEGFDLVALKKWILVRWYIRKPGRIITRLKGEPSLRGKLSFLRELASAHRGGD